MVTWGVALGTLWEVAVGYLEKRRAMQDTKS